MAVKAWVEYTTAVAAVVAGSLGAVRGGDYLDGTAELGGGGGSDTVGGVDNDSDPDFAAGIDARAGHCSMPVVEEAAVPVESIASAVHYAPETPVLEVFLLASGYGHH